MIKNSAILFRGKKAFSLMEVLIATSLLSVVMLSLFQVKSNNIFILEKSFESKKQKEYISLVIDSKEYLKRDKKIYLDKYFNINDDEIRREFKEVKIKLKDELLNKKEKKFDTLSIGITNFKTRYSFENGIKKDIYKFKVEL